MPLETVTLSMTEYKKMKGWKIYAQELELRLWVLQKERDRGVHMPCIEDKQLKLQVEELQLKLRAARLELTRGDMARSAEKGTYFYGKDVYEHTKEYYEDLERNK